MDLHVTLHGRRDVSGQLYRQIRDAILDGRLRAGESLPSTRDLTQHLRVSRNTVLLVYERLRAEGFVATRVGAGTFVSEGIHPRSKAGSVESPIKPRSFWNGVPEAPDMASITTEFDFRPGIPDAREFPLAAWRARMARQFHPSSVGSGAHIGAAGLGSLRAALARHIGASRAVRATADDVVITSGSQQAIDLIARVLLEPGEMVVVEDPCYPLPRRAFEAQGCRVVGVPVDADGMIVEAIPERARLVYVTPSHQYPLGMSMSLSRRQALLDWARRTNGIIIEDDYDSEFRYGGRPLEPLQSLDDSGRVLYVGSLSKVMLPTLRLGFVVAPASIHPALCKAKFLADWHTPVATQGAAASFIEDGLLAQHIRRMRRIYAERHERLRGILVESFSGCLTPLPSAGGLHFTAYLEGRAPASDTEVAKRAREAGIAILPLSYHYVTREPRAGLKFGYGAIQAERIEEGLSRLRACL